MKLSDRILQDLNNDELFLGNLVREAFNHKLSMNCYERLRTMEYQLSLMQSRVSLLREALLHEEMKAQQQKEI